jgi:hypothetical protein
MAQDEDIDTNDTTSRDEDLDMDDIRTDMTGLDDTTLYDEDDDIAV